MNSRERVKCAFQHQEADMVPVSELAVHSPAAGEILNRAAITGEGGWVKREQLRLIVNGQRDEFVTRYHDDTLDLFRHLGLDMIVAELDVPKNSSLRYENIEDNTWMTVDESSGIWTKYAYEKNADVVFECDSSLKRGGIEAVMEFADYLNDLDYSIDESQFETAQHYIQKAGKEIFITAKPPNLFPVGLSWFPQFLEVLYLEPEFGQKVLDYYLNRVLKVVNKYISIGVDCILIGGDWAYNTGPFVSPDYVRKYFVPQIKAVAELCHKNNILLLKHTDGNIMKIADDFFNMGIDGFQGIEPNAGMSLSDLKKQYGSKITFMGNVDCAQILQYGSTEDVIKETKRCIRQGASGGGYILSSSNSIHSMIPTRNFLTMLETARKYGKYPIEIQE